MDTPVEPVASETGQDARADLEARLRLALAEVERLTVPDDRGSGERTARMAGLALWEAEVARLRGILDAGSGGSTDAG